MTVYLTRSLLLANALAFSLTLLEGILNSYSDVRSGDGSTAQINEYVNEFDSVYDEVIPDSPISVSSGNIDACPSPNPDHPSAQ